jgi:hypothetical protein
LGVEPIEVAIAVVLPISLVYGTVSHGLTSANAAGIALSPINPIVRLSSDVSWDSIGFNASVKETFVRANAKGSNSPELIGSTIIASSAVASRPTLQASTQWQ